MARTVGRKLLLAHSENTTRDRSAVTAFGAAVWHTGPESAVVVLSGDLDVATAPELHALLTELCDRDVTDLVVDLANLEFIDSSGISVIVAGLERLKVRGGSLSVRNPNPVAMRVFEVTALTDYLSVAGGPDSTA